MNSARTLFAALVDYAGLFPPAELQMRAAVPQYAGYRAGPHAWMLGRFVLPLAQLEEFEHWFDEVPAGERETPWGLTVLAGRSLETDVKRIVDFNRRHGDEGRRDAKIEGIELKVHSLDDVARDVDVIAEPPEAYFEVGLATDPQEWIAAVAAEGARLKVRTGGVSPEMFPSVPDVARFLHTAAAQKVPFKATAGLHHAFRSDHPLAGDQRHRQVAMHGFLNLFVAAGLAYADRVGTDLLEKVLDERSGAAFAFDQTGVSVHGRRLTCEDLATTRRRFAISYGSCSLDEPIAELKGLGLI
jgi:hypothetical protein